MMKKVLAFALTGAMVLSSFSMAFADTTTAAPATTEPTPAGTAGKSLSDVAESPNKEAIGVVNDLGIVVGTPDGAFLPTKDVTRAEYAAMITRALAIPNSALEGYKAAPFKDISGYEWARGYLAFCNSKGIMLGDGVGNAMPGRTITTNEAITMALRTVGYLDNSSELKGMWPSNYVTKAQELNLYQDVAKNNVGATRENAAQIIYNILTVQKVAVNTDGKTEKLWTKAPTYDNKGTVNNGAERVTLLTSGLNCTEEDPTVVTTDDLDTSSINLAKHLGQYGTLYRSKDTKKFVAFIQIDNGAQLVGRFKSATEFVTTDSEETYTIKGQFKDAKISYLENGEFKNADKDAVADVVTNANYGWDDGKDNEYSIYVDLSGKSIKNVYAINRWKVDSAAKVGTGDLYKAGKDRFMGYKLAKDDNKNVDTKQYDLVGVNSLTDIKADNVVYVYVAPGGDHYITKIEVGTKSVDGIVKNYKEANSGETLAPNFKIGDVVYKNAQHVVNGVTNDNNKLVDSDSVGETYNVLLDGRGYVYSIVKSTKASNYAVVERHEDGIDNQVKLMLADGSEKVFNYDAGTENDKISKKDSKNAKDMVIGYGVNKDGKITVVNMRAVKAKIKLGSRSYIKDIDDKALLAGTKGVTLDQVKKTAKIDSNVVVFTYNSGKEEYDVTTIDKVNKNEDIAGATLLFDEPVKDVANTVLAMIVPSEKAKDGTKSYAVINKKVKTINKDNDVVWAIDGFKDGVAMSGVLTSDKTVLSTFNIDTNDDPFTCALLEVKTNKDGVITDATNVDDASILGVNKDKPVAEAKVIDNDVKNSTKVFKVKSADGRKSVNATDDDGLTLSSEVKIYEITSDDEYRLHNGDLKKGDMVKLYNVDTDKDGYDVVIFVRPDANANANVPAALTPVEVAIDKVETKDVFEDSEDAKQIVVTVNNNNIKWDTVNATLKDKVVLSGAGVGAFSVASAVGSASEVTITLNNKIMGETDTTDLKVALNIKDVAVDGDKKVQDNLPATAVTNKVKHVVNVTDAKGGTVDAGGATKVKLTLAKEVTGITKDTFKVASGADIDSASDNAVTGVANETTTTVELTVTTAIEQGHHFKVTVANDNAKIKGKAVKFKLAPSLGDVTAK